MSKLFDMEPQSEQKGAEVLRKIQSQARQQDAFDAEAALHVELLTQTDAKLDRINARLDRFSGELSQWGQRVEQAQQRLREKGAASERRSPAGAILLLLLGAVSGAVYMASRNSEMPITQQALSEPVSMPVEFSVDKSEPVVQEEDSAESAAELKPENAPLLLELTRNEPLLEILPQPPVSAGPKPPPVPEAVAAVPVAEPVSKGIIPVPESVESVPAAEPVSKDSTPLSEPVSRDVDLIQPVVNPSTHGRIQF